MFRIFLPPHTSDQPGSCCSSLLITTTYNNDSFLHLLSARVVLKQSPYHHNHQARQLPTTRVSDDNKGHSLLITTTYKRVSYWQQRSQPPHHHNLQARQLPTTKVSADKKGRYRQQIEAINDYRTLLPKCLLNCVGKLQNGFSHAQGDFLTLGVIILADSLLIDIGWSRTPESY